MLPLETSKAGLTKTDFDILSYLEYPKTFEQLKKQFPNVNVAKKLLDFQEKELIHENKLKYVTRLYTPDIKKIIDNSQVPEDVKKNFLFFLSQIDDPFIRDVLYGSDTRKKSEYVFSIITKSLVKPLTKKETILLGISVEDLVNKLR